MKRILKSMLASVLSFMFIVMSMGVNAFAAATPTFSLNVVKEEKDYVIVSVKLDSGAFTSVNFEVNGSGNVGKCEYILTTDEYDAAEKQVRVAGGQTINAPYANGSTGKFGAALSVAFDKTGKEIVTCKFAKNTADKVSNKDLTLVVTSCNDGEDKVVTAKAVNNLPVQESIFKITLNNSNADKAGTSAYWYYYNTVKNGVYYYTDAACSRPLVNSTIVCPEKAGYEFKGYYSAVNGGGKQYVNENGVCVNNIYKTIGSKVLYAYWEMNHSHNYVLSRTVSSTCIAEGSKTYKCSICGASYTEAIAKTSHSYKYTTVKPNCTEQGYTLVTCNNCTYSSKYNYVDAVGHIWNPWVVEKAATLTATGLKKHTCSVCGIVESEIIPKTDHIHDYVLTKTVDSTCAADGSKTYKCSICGDSYSEKISKKNHSLVKHVVDPTCTEEGYTYYSCKTCDGTFSTSIKTPATGHSFGEWKVTKAATVSATGTKQRTCANCGKVETQTIPKLAHTHSYSLTKTVAATCQKEGSKIYTCSCGDSYTEAIPKTSHSLVKHVVDPTCTEEGYTYYTCKTCDGKFNTSAKTPATGHRFGEWKVTKAATVSATGTKQRTCANCGKVETQTIPKIAHTHSYSLTKTVAATCQKEGSKVYTCSCGDSYTETIAKTDHSYTKHVVDPTCTEEGYTYYSCKTCDGKFNTSAKTPATGHSFGEWKVTKAATVSATGTKQRTCANCGKVETQTIPKIAHTHTYSLTKTIAATCQKEGSKVYTCSCGASYTEAIPKTNHSLVKHVVDPTCTEEGYTYYSCKTCDGKFNTSAKTPATGHSFGEWKVTKAATTTSTGVKERKCSKCGAVERGTVPMIVPTQTKITLNTHDLALDYKSTSSLKASSDNVKWTSSNTKVATVDNNGNVKAVGTGSAVITATDTINGTTDTCNVKVSYTWWQWAIVIGLFGWIWY